MAKASGFGLMDLMNVPDHVFAAVMEDIEKQQKKQRLQGLKDRLRSKR